MEKVKILISIYPEQRDWLKANNTNVSEYFRRLLDKLMK
jgi:hypothetical protein